MYRISTARAGTSASPTSRSDRPCDSSVQSQSYSLALTFVMSGFGPAATAQQLAGRSGDDHERRHRDGQAIFRYDTFGDEQLWTDVLRMHEVIATVPPTTALAVGLKVDVDALPPHIIAALRAGQVDLTNPAVTIELLRLNAVVGVRGKVSETGQLTSVGITCALCHSCVDNSFTTGVRRISWRSSTTMTGCSR